MKSTLFLSLMNKLSISVDFYLCVWVKLKEGGEREPENLTYNLVV